MREKFRVELTFVIVQVFFLLITSRAGSLPPSKEIVDFGLVRFDIVMLLHPLMWNFDVANLRFVKAEVGMEIYKKYEAYISEIEKLEKQKEALTVKLKLYYSEKQIPSEVVMALKDIDEKMKALNEKYLDNYVSWEDSYWRMRFVVTSALEVVRAVESMLNVKMLLINHWLPEPAKSIQGRDGFCKGPVLCFELLRDFNKLYLNNSFSRGVKHSTYLGVVDLTPTVIAKMKSFTFWSFLNREIESFYKQLYSKFDVKSCYFLEEVLDEGLDSFKKRFLKKENDLKGDE